MGAANTHLARIIVVWRVSGYFSAGAGCSFAFLRGVERRGVAGLRLRARGGQDNRRRRCWCRIGAYRARFRVAKGAGRGECSACCIGGRTDNGLEALVRRPRRECMAARWVKLLGCGRRRGALVVAGVAQRRDRRRRRRACDAGRVLQTERRHQFDEGREGGHVESVEGEDRCRRCKERIS